MITSAGERNTIKFDRLPRKTIGNRVLVKVDFLPEDGHILKKGDLELEFAGSEYNEAAHVSRFGEVVMIPGKLINKSIANLDYGMEWDTEIETKEGDTVYFGKMASANAQVLEIEGSVYYVLEYGDLILRVRDGEIYPLNGYALLESVVEGVRIDGLYLEFGDFVNKKLGVVRYVGRPSSSYFGIDLVDADVEVGDEVVFRDNMFGEIEEDMFASLEKGLGYCQRRWIIAKTN